MSATFLTKPLVSFAFCWRVERSDGVTLGLTSHDRDLTIDALRYRAAPGITPSAIEDADATARDALEIAGALTADTIREADLRSGRWDGAAVHVFAVDWSAAGQHVQISKGELGAVSLERGRFTAQISGPGAILDRPIIEQTSPTCRAELGDRRCRVDLAGRRWVARVVASSDDTVTLDEAEPEAGAWTFGKMRWLDGDSGGLTTHVTGSEGAVARVDGLPPFPIFPGDRCEITEGCDKRLETCRDRFGNAANFRGEPHLPGIDLLTRFPGE